eukprot:767922-Hanusia_phi.AAC.8
MPAQSPSRGGEYQVSPSYRTQSHPDGVQAEMVTADAIPIATPWVTAPQISKSSINSELKIINSSEDAHSPINFGKFCSNFYNPINLYNKLREHLETSDEYSPFFAQPDECDAYSRRERVLVFINTVLVILATSSFLLTMTGANDFTKQATGAMLSPILQGLMLNKVLKKIFKAKADEGGCFARLVKKFASFLALILYGVSCFIGVLFIMLAFECKFYTFAKPSVIASALEHVHLNRTAITNVSTTFPDIRNVTVNGTLEHNRTEALPPWHMVFVCETKSQQAAEAFCSRLGGRLPLFDNSSELQSVNEILNKRFAGKIVTTGKQLWTGRLEYGSCTSLSWSEGSPPSLTALQPCSDLLQFICLVHDIPSFKAELEDCKCDNKTSTLVGKLFVQYASSFFFGNVAKYFYNVFLAPIYFLCLGVFSNRICKALDWTLMEDWAKSDAAGNPAIKHEHKDIYFTLLVCYDEPSNMCCCSTAELADRASRSLTSHGQSAGSMNRE